MPKTPSDKDKFKKFGTGLRAPSKNDKAFNEAIKANKKIKELKEKIDKKKNPNKK